MKKIVTISFSLLCTLGAGAQSRLSSTITDMLSSVNQQISDAQQVQAGSKFPMSATAEACPVDTAAIQNDMVVNFNPDGTVKTVDVIAWLADGATCPVAALTSKGISINGEALGAVFLTVPVEQLEYLETLDEFSALNANSINHPDNDNSRSVINVNNVNGIDKPTYTFDTPYTGKGVVVGIIDSGIDYNHVAFKDSEGNTRVKKVVHFASSSTTNPTVATTPEAIAALTWDNSTGDDKSHGTHVACSAAGSKLDVTIDYDPKTRNLMGMAPEADIVLCGTSNLGDAKVLKSVEQIVATAKELNEPCVINMSFGTTGDWHDGKTNINNAINSVAGKGVIVCMSTANEAMYKWNVDKTIPADGYMKAILTKTVAAASSNKSYIPSQTLTFRVPNCSTLGSVTASFEVVDTLTGAYTTLSTVPLKTGSGTIYNPSLSFSKDASHNGWLKASLSLSQSYFDDNNKFLVIKIHNNTDAPLRVYAMSSNKERDGFASTTFPTYEYDEGTADISINNSCSADNFISVGAYNRSRSFVSYAGTGYSFSVAQTGENNSTAKYSSYGRDDFGKVHPDVISPGIAITSAYNYYNKAYADASATDWKSTFKDKGAALIAAYYTEASGKNNLWYVTNGTSMASPIAAGTIALWLQAYPDLTPADVREVIEQTSRSSVNGAEIAVTAGSTEQNRFQLGNGLIDAEAGIKYVLDNFVTPTGIKNVSDAASAEQTTKKLVNCNIVIDKNGKQYTAAGQRVK